VRKCSNKERSPKNYNTCIFF